MNTIAPSKNDLLRFRMDSEQMKIDANKAYSLCVEKPLRKSSFPVKGLLNAENSDRYEDTIIHIACFDDIYMTYLETNPDTRYKGYGKWTDPSLSFTHAYITNKPSAKLTCSLGQSWTSCWRPSKSRIYPLVYNNWVYIVYFMRGHKVRGRVFITRMDEMLIMFNLAGTEIHWLLLEEILRAFYAEKFGNIPDVRKFDWISSVAEFKDAEVYGDAAYIFDIEPLYVAFHDHITLCSPASLIKETSYYTCPSCGRKSLCTNDDTVWCENKNCDINKFAEEDNK